MNDVLLFLANVSLAELFAQTPDLPLLNIDEYRPISMNSHCTVMPNDQPLDFQLEKTSLVSYSDSDD